MKTLKTTFRIALLTVLFVVAGGALGGQGGMVTAFLFALIMNGLAQGETANGMTARRDLRWACSSQPLLADY